MAKKKSKDTSNAPSETQEAQALPTNATEATVLDPQGNPHRTYSLAIHGDNFKELAEQFVSVRPGWTVR